MLDEYATGDQKQWNILQQKIEEADMILVGLGEEFDTGIDPENLADYQRHRDLIKESQNKWLLPICQRKYGEKKDEKIKDLLNKFACKLEKKNYFVISTSTNDMIQDVSWKKERLVMPCGGSWQKQCINGCKGSISLVSKEEKRELKSSLDNTNASCLGVCPECGSPFVLNNVFVESYDENGYLEDWERYTKWLQGTMNKKMLLLELGVGLQYPSVIRWPFEKIAFFQKKADFYRVNEKLYQLTPELAEKGVSVAKHAVDWLENFCEQ